jgi:hypothetical protein
MPPRFFASIAPARVRVILHFVGLAVLLAGYSGAALVWRPLARIDQENADLAANAASPLSPLDSRKDTRQIELYYGKSGLLMEGATEWIESFAHGKRLAETLVVLSSATAIGCFIAAGRRTS